MDAASTIITIVMLLASVLAASVGVGAYRAFGGLSEISCPETMEAALLAGSRTISPSPRSRSCTESRGRVFSSACWEAIASARTLSSFPPSRGV
jgi:hypothetical protein